LFLGLLCWCDADLYAQDLRFDLILADALQNAMDTQIARQHLLATRAQLNEVLSDSYPQLSLRLGNEYVHVFEAQDDVVSVGDAIIADTVSGYKHSLSLSVQYTLYDFGRRGLAANHARHQVQLAGLQQQLTSQQIRREVVAVYARALKLQRRIKTQQVLCAGLQDIYRLSERLYRAGRSGREAVGAAALNLAEALARYEELRTGFVGELQGLTFYTRKEYPGSTAVLQDLKSPGWVGPAEADLTLAPEVLVYQKEIEKKQTELAMTRRERTPQFILSGALRMYGSHPRRFTESLTSLSARDSRATLFIDLPLFDGFRSSARRSRLQHELSRLNFEKQKKQDELNRDFSREYQSYTGRLQQQSARAQQRLLIERQADDLWRLTGQQLVDQITAQQQHMELARRQLELDLQEIEQVVSAWLLFYMSGVH
jgi:outer membrane protein TolC